jgi:hypothetical protein
MPGLIALKNPEKRLHHWLETSMMISGITQKMTRKIKAMRVTTIQGGRVFILSEIVFGATFSLLFEIFPFRLGSSVSFSLIDFILFHRLELFLNSLFFYKKSPPCRVQRSFEPVFTGWVPPH